jgi:SAM-dependent methyltransferase
VRFGSLRRLSPLSRDFGYERGLPIDRYYIERFLERQRADVRGHVLEVSEDTYTVRFGQGVTSIDVLHVRPGAPKATIIADLADAPHVPADSFDCVIVTQTLQLIHDAAAAVRTIHRILRPGGVVLATFPGLTQILGEWAGTWHWGFTRLSAEKLFRAAFGDGAVEVESHGNVLAATAFLHGLASCELRPRELEHRDPEYQLLITVRARKGPGTA